MTLHRLSTQCPSCGAPPRIRVFPREFHRHAHDDPAEPVKTYQCRCGEVYVIYAAAYQRRELPPAV